MTLTPKQVATLKFIRDFVALHGFSPSLQEIGYEFGITRVSVFERVSSLVEKGVLLRGDKYVSRTLRLSPDFEFPDSPDQRTCPTCGTRIED